MKVTPEEWAVMKMQADDLKAYCKAQGRPAVVMLAVARHLRTSPIAAETMSILGELVVNGEEAFEAQYGLTARQQ